MSLPDPARPDPAASRPASQSPAARPARWWHEPIMWLVVGGPVLVVLAGIITAWLAVSDADPLVMPDAARRTERALEPALKARNAASTDAAQQAAAAARAVKQAEQEAASRR